MFRSVRTTKRKDSSIPFFHEVYTPSKEFHNAFFMLYVATGKFLTSNRQLSRDLLEVQFTTEWDSKESFIDMLTETNQHISEFHETANCYNRDNGLIDYSSMKELTFDEKTEILANDEVTPIEFYQQPHIFVVFRPGASGNFISNLIDNLMTQNLTDMSISTTGHVHYNSIVERKRSGVDYISLGTGLPGVDIPFFMREEKIEYYKSKIALSNYQNKPYVTWTHSFSNIPVYKSLFPNCRILVINDCTLHERLVSMVMNINKNHFSSDDQTPFSIDDNIKPIVFKLKTIKDNFARFYPNKTYSTGHRDLDLSLMYRCFLRIHELEKYWDQDLTSNIPYEDDGTNASLTFLESNAQFSTGREFIPQADFSIDLINILTKSFNRIIDVVENTIGRKLSDLESEYVKLSIEKYVDSQNNDIISNPRNYIATIKEKADTIVSAL